MSVEAEIHRRLAAYSPLVALVTTARMATGTAPSETEDGEPLGLPYLALHRTGESEYLTPSGGIVLETLTLKLAVYATTLAAAKKIAKLARARITGAYTYLGGRVLNARQAAASEIERDDGTWVIETDLSVMTQEP